jgi:hypothetical protein
MRITWRGSLNYVPTRARKESKQRDFAYDSLFFDTILEPKYTEDATNFVKENRYIYHITNKDNLKNILKKGLRPKAKKNNSDEIYRYFIDRVYFTVHSANIKQDLINVINDLGYTIYSNEYAILKIDIEKLNITFWWDDASQGTTVYTYESIHPKFINVIDFDNI